MCKRKLESFKNPRLEVIHRVSGISAMSLCAMHVSVGAVEVCCISGLPSEHCQVVVGSLSAQSVALNLSKQAASIAAASTCNCTSGVAYVKSVVAGAERARRERSINRIAPTELTERLVRACISGNNCDDNLAVHTWFKHVFNRESAVVALGMDRGLQQAE